VDIIIGAGVSGLAYSRFSKKPNMILEKSDEIGGYCKTIKRNGFVWDYSGHFFHFKEDWVKSLFLEYMDAGSLIEVEKITTIKYKEKSIDFPFQKNIHQLEFSEFIDCIHDLILSNENNKSFQITTFKEMVYAKYGKAIGEKFLIPYNEKLYACDLNELDSDAMGRFFPAASLSDIVRNFKKFDNVSYNGTFNYPLGGAIEFINSLSKNLEGNICTNEEVLHINLKAKELTTSKGRVLKYDNLISSMPLPKLLDISGIEYPDSVFTSNKVLVFNIGFDRKSVCDDHWVYFPEKKYPFYRVGFYDNITSSERMSLYVEIGLKSNEEFNVHELYCSVIEGLKEAGVIVNHEVIDWHHVVMDPAYVHINKNSEALKKEVLSKLRTHSVYSIGRYGAWKYCSIEDNVIESNELVKKLYG